MTDRYPPSIEIARLYERASAKGTRYMSGLLGLARVTLLPGDPADDGTPTWRLLIAARPEKGEAPRSPVREAQASRRRPPYSPPQPRGTKAHVDFGDRADDIGGAP